MKIRNGFVSNSSSSSFIIRDSEFTVKELAEKMVKIVSEDSEEKLKMRLKTLESTKDDESVHFYSCNADTYIMPHKDLILIKTCNNEDWDFLDQMENCIDVEYDDAPGLLLEYPELDPDGEGYIDMYGFFKQGEFTCLERGGIRFKDTDSWDRCEMPGSNYDNTCAGKMVIIDDEEQCGICFHTTEKKPSRYYYRNREEKLKRILDERDN